MRFCPACARAFTDTETFCPHDNAELLDHDPMVGKIAGTKYEVLSRLGRGGMGVVYKARHIFMDRTVALKIVNPRLTANPRYLDMLRQEALAAARFSHPNAVTLLDFGFFGEDETFYMVMEYIQGRSLRKLLRKHRVLLPLRALKIMRQVVLAVAAGHREGIVHLDLKPENIMICHRGADRSFVKVLDFGIAHFMDRPHKERVAKRTPLKERARKIFGTANYMSPEQIQDIEVDGRSDVYSIGIVLYEAIAGRHPFKGRDKLDLMKKHLRARPRRLAKAASGVVPKDLDRLVMRALEKDPDKRHPTADAFAEDLRRVELALRGVELGETGESSSSSVYKVSPSRIGGIVERIKDKFSSKGPQTDPDIPNMVLVPGGEFAMGSDSGPSDERPRHRASVAGFWIDLYLVTNEDYKRFVDATGHDPPGHWKTVSFPPGLGRHPVVEISWHDAEAYAHWIGKRLPTEQEWERAARGTDARPFPWGKQWDSKRCNWGENPGRVAHPGASPVGAFAGDRSPCECCDMAGNVMEWTDTWYDRYFLSSENNADFGRTYKVLRGGSWQSRSRTYLRTAKRSHDLPESTGQYGFRCVLDPSHVGDFKRRRRELGM